MRERVANRIELLQGTRDRLILETLVSERSRWERLSLAIAGILNPLAKAKA